MAHTKPTVEDVKNRWSTSMTDPQIQVAIDDAAAFVDRRLGGKGVSDDLLERINALMAIHYAHLRDPEAQQVRIGRDQFTYQDEPGDGRISGTWAGKRAILLDPTGTLAELDQEEGFQLDFHASGE